MMRVFGICLALALAGAFQLSAQDVKVPETALKEWKETIDFGIDTQIIEVVKKVRASGETSLNPDLLSVLAKSVNPTLRKEILVFFTDTKYAQAEPAAFTLLANYENEDGEVLRALVAFLAEIKSKRSLEYMLKLADAEDSVVAYSAIAALGRLGDASQASLLLKKLRDPEVKPDRKPTIITALGDMQAKEALPELIKILESRGEEHVWRMYAAESLGKLGDPSAVPVLKKVMAENDPLLKAYAAGALARFDLAAVMDTLIECLKDSYWKVRVAACQGLARPGANKAVDILVYKVNKDPEMPVKTEAIKALAAIGSEGAYAFLRELVNDRGKTTQLREFALDTLLEKNMVGETAAAVERVIKLEWGSKDRIIEVVAQRLSRKASPLLKKAITLFLDHPNAAIRVYAIRGVGLNRFTDQRGRLLDIEKRDPVEQVKKEAREALEKL